MSRIKAAGTYLICFALLLALGYGIGTIYNTFFHVRDDGFCSLFVFLEQETAQENTGGGDHPPAGRRGGSSSGQKDQSETVTVFIDRINKWAREENALLMAVNGTNPQIFFSDHPAAKKKLKAKEFEGVSTGLYLPEKLMADEYYVKDGVFLPTRQRIMIQGSISTAGLMWLRNTDYWFLSWDQYRNNTLEGLNGYTFLTDSQNFDGLRTILEENGYKVTQLSSERMNLKEFLQTITSERQGGSLYSYLAQLLTLLTIGFSFVLLRVTGWRGCIKRERIRHLCGKPLYATVLEIMVAEFLLGTAAGVIWPVLMSNLWNYMSEKELREAGTICGLLFLSLAMTAGIASTAVLRKGMRKGGLV